MNRRLGLSMRVVETQYPSGSTELRDALAQDWGSFLDSALPECPWLPLPNVETEILRLVTSFDLQGLLLTGGDDWGQTPSRDVTEMFLLRWAHERHIPVIGICRGAQIMNSFLGGTLSTVSEAHRARHHPVCWNSQTLMVNSYHQQGFFTADLSSQLICQATADDGSIEAFSHPELPWCGIMWHPERESCFEFDRKLFRDMFMENACILKSL